MVDAKAPLASFLDAAGADDAERAALLAAHARALRGHVDALAARGYWQAFTPTPEMVVCFVPADAVLAAALDADPGLHEHAMSQRVVLASPATLMALLRTVAFTWQQDALAGNAREPVRGRPRACTCGSAAWAPTPRSSAARSLVGSRTTTP
ncbi:hypothetical protein GCM10025868_13440 [Angustibacter aerolatus]|uniref:Uncharacterized protein n=1 Tax=Angustibacter aerolatus TaxID=1162965 RepID=A0ABQ6JFA5_9ACTN|nr:hypothetical protein GCM10025868_13440 [Angustibacter aerolatus]